jgi:hypothetical protein
VEGKPMSRLTLWLSFFLVTSFFALSAGLSSAQSLVDVAKKEKERRAKIENQGETTRVITDRELQTSVLPESVPADAPSGEGETTPSVQAAETGEGQEEGEEDQTKSREYWQTRVEGVKKKIAGLEEKLQSPELNWGEGIRNDVNPIGQRNLSQRQDLEGQLAQAKAELRAIQTEARRAGVPPGWVR